MLCRFEHPFRRKNTPQMKFLRNDILVQYFNQHFQLDLHICQADIAHQGMHGRI